MLPEAHKDCLKPFLGSCLRCDMVESEKLTWANLSANEKAKLLAYMRILLSNKKPSRLMLEYVNNIYAKYPDFSTACIPI